MQFFLQLIVVLAILGSAFAGKAKAVAAPVKEKNFIEKSVDMIHDLTKGHSMTAEVKDTATGGLEGLNVQVTAPFKFMDYVVGANAKIGDLKSLAPETLFIRRNFDTSDGNLKVQADYNLKDKKADYKSEWSNKHISLNAQGDSTDYVTKIGAKTSHVFEGASRNLKATVSGAYDLLTKRVDTTTRLDVDGISAEIEYDTEKEDPTLQVHYDVGKDRLSPKISLKSGDITYGYRHAMQNGHLDTTLHPGDNVVVEWTDNAKSGAWKTKVDVPLQDQTKTKVSFSRDWAL